MSAQRLWTRGIGVVSVSGLALVGAVACQQASAKDSEPAARAAQAANAANADQGARAYDAVDTQTWREKRENDLKAPDGWLSVSGLHFLEPGITTIGTTEVDNVSLPPGSIPAKAGRVRVEAGRVFLTLAKGVQAKINGEPIKGDGEIELRDASAPNAPEKRPADNVTLGRVTLHVHHSGDRLALRVRDPESPIRKEFVGLRWYDIDSAWQFEGRFIPYDQPKQLQIPNVLGDQEAVESPGEVQVTIGGRTARLLALSAARGRLWFVFTDSTADIKETYRIRFLYADAPVNGRVTLDFNRAYNPPCAYNPYTTCPLPPQQNKLQTPITAGERAYAGPHAEPVPTASE